MMEDGSLVKGPEGAIHMDSVGSEVFGELPEMAEPPGGLPPRSEVPVMLIPNDGERPQESSAERPAPTHRGLTMRRKLMLAILLAV